MSEEFFEVFVAACSHALGNYRLSLAGGDPARGKRLFRDHPSAQCFKCHKCEGGDSVVGPDLSKIGAQKDRNYLLESIIFPNKTIAQGFQIVVLTLKSDTTVVGRLLSEANGKLEVETVNDKGKTQNVSVEAAQIKTRTSAASPMPESIREVLTRSDLRDILEYMATRK